jgi:ribonuclease P/MRP protein subunit RPP1
MIRATRGLDWYVSCQVPIINGLCFLHSNDECEQNKSNDALLQTYDILSLHPTSPTTFSSACLTHSAPSTLTTHIISLPLTFPRMPFFFKHTLVRTAIKNGAVLEVAYSPAVGGAGDSERRNWWANVRELTRVTKGKGVIFSSGSSEVGDVRAPGDVANM